MNRNQWIAVGIGLGLLTYLLFSGPLINLFSKPMTTNNPEINKQPAGLEVREVSVGTGEIAEPGDTVSAHYVGTLTDGRVFDSSRDRGTPISFTLGVGQVIRGWDEGIQGMRAGGTRILTISPEYAYGSQAVGAIPANSTLVFEVELVSVEKATR